MSRYLGIDLGEKRIGIAVSDPTLTIAQPLITIKFISIKRLAASLRELIAEYEIERIICGLPITLKGTWSEKTNETAEIAAKLGKLLAPIEVELFDERLTTVQAHNTLQLMGKRPSRERDKVDQLAALHLLQNYLDLEKTRSKT